MKNKTQPLNENKAIEINWGMATAGLFCMIMIGLFNSGKIIDFPHGTKEGGVIAAIGSFVIIVLSIAIGFLIQIIGMKISKKNTGRKSV